MFSEEQMLELVKQSPAAVAAHDRAAWLGLFSDDAEVHDPVGSQAHRGREALGRFYDTFIAPNDIRFRVEHDVVGKSTVVRDLVISTAMGGTKLTVDVPLFIRYQIVDQGGSARIHRLYAHWELAPMINKALFSQGLLQGCGAMLRLSANMLGQQGLSGAMGFSKAFLGLGKAAKLYCSEVLQMLAQGEVHSGLAQCQIHCNDELVDPAQLAENLKGLRWEKLLAGGRYVSARLIHSDWRGVAIFQLPNSRSTISSLQIYSDKR